MAAYLTLVEFKLRSVMPPEYIDAIEVLQPGWTLAQLEQQSRWLDSRLRKRYAAPFAAPYPEAVLSWVARLTTVRVFLRRGVDPTDAQFDLVREDAKAATDEIKEAADSNVGLFDLPEHDTSTATGVSKGAPQGYSEQSPYVGFSQQATTGRDEDAAGEGSYV
jgi:hypothetical protein